MNLLKPNATLHPSNATTIVYRELNNDSDFEQCINLQHNIFGLPDTHLVSPLFLKLYSRNDPPSGIAVGVFNNSTKSELLGFIIGSATFIDKSVYIVMLGIKPEHKNKMYGYKLLMKFKEVAITRQLTHAFGVYEPLEVNLARLYITPERFEGIKYMEEPQNNDSLIPSDKLLVKWNFYNSSENLTNHKSINFNQAILNYPIVSENFLPDTNKVLIEIPPNYLHDKETDFSKAMVLRISTRKIFNEYINNRKYIASNCLTGIINKQRKSYYLLEQK